MSALEKIPCFSFPRQSLYLVEKVKKEVKAGSMKNDLRARKRR